MPAAAVPDFIDTSFAPQPPPQPQWQSLTIRFTGSGSEYFRIWIVNLLLILVTLSLYLPYARARRLRYFHGNTRVDGHALGFHGSGHAMLRGYLLVLLFTGLYALAGRTSPLAAGVAGLLLAGLWPALWHASLRFRLASTSWRGLHFAFTGTLAGAYRCMAPAMALGGVLLLLTALRGDPRDAEHLIGAWADVAVGLGVLLALLGAPLLAARIKRYQHGHYRYAGETTTLQADNRDFVRLWMRGGGVSALGLLGLVVVVGATLWVLPRGQGARLSPAVAAVLTILIGTAYLALLFVLQAWYGARLQNLVWSATASPRLRFGSDLRVRDLALLSLKNLILTVLTLGLYRPFAAVAVARLRLQAMSLQVLGPVDAWVAGAMVRPGDAAGDAAGDLLGVDLGL